MRGGVWGFEDYGSPDDRLALWARLEAQEYEDQQRREQEGAAKLEAVVATFDFELMDDPAPEWWVLGLEIGDLACSEEVDDTDMTEHTEAT